jgi:hypothetical protein
MPLEFMVDLSTPHRWEINDLGDAWVGHHRSSSPAATRGTAISNAMIRRGICPSSLLRFILSFIQDEVGRPK